MMRKITRASYKIMPWKNGGGTTAEIDREPRGEEPYLWRLSQATVASEGPFSNFPGYDRWLCLVRGDDLLLNERRLTLKAPYRFSGEEKIECRLTGLEALDVGLIFDRARVSAEMKVVGGKVSGKKGTHYLYDFTSGDTLRFDGPFELELVEALCIHLTQNS